MATVLVVDDSAVDRRLVSGLLKKVPNMQVETAENGRDAVTRLRDLEVDLVVTDLQMPELDGLGLVREVRDEYPEVPVILITAHGSEELALEALHAGAASYVPKSELAELLQESVEQVLNLTREDRSYEKLSDCQTRAEFTFELVNDTELIDPLVELVQQLVSSLGLCDTTGKYRIGMALQQALANAIIHGNLELNADQMQDAREALITGRGRGVFEERQRQQPYVNRHVFVDIKIDRNRAQFVVRDEGPGFDARQYPTHANGDGELKRGRGIRLMRTFMDEVAFNDRGNEVMMVKKCERA
jgi:CheY-like chemotaxis protein